MANGCLLHVLNAMFILHLKEDISLLRTKRETANLKGG